MKENDNKKSLKEMWKDPQKKAIIKLGLWFVFFALTFLFLSIASLFSKHNNLNNNNNENNQNNQNYQEEKVEANIPKMLEKLIDSDYGFEIKIINQNIIENISGTVKSKITTGYYENNNNILKFSYHDQNYYQIIDNNEVLNNELLNEEYRKNIDIHSILEIIKNYEMTNETLKENNEYIYNISDNYVIKISTNQNNIDKINITNNDVSYEMKFNLII